ncbi:hypothetical protein ACHHV8_09940 [Paenibacillus sp. TAB 01]|uniref:hypothetical protein n=1 Tax=Paenibacillus sp. TAB 01 TaxID=3368988 RepID=UPI0037516FC9
MNIQQIMALNINDLGQKVREATKLPLFLPARDNASAWSLVEHLREKGVDVTINTASEESSAVKSGTADLWDWHVCLSVKTPEWGRLWHRVYAKTMPEAVFRAYLLYHFGP